MSPAVVGIRVDGEIKGRLDALGAATGRPAAYCVRDAMMEHLDELEYAYQLKGEAEVVRRGEIETISSAGLVGELFS